jgi:prepilin signal peptidase PulO-like enzyme (type II secretory pathway)
MRLRPLETGALGAATFAASAVVNDLNAASIARLTITGAALAAAAAFDLNERRIPNLLTFPTALSLLIVWAGTGATIGRIESSLVVVGVLFAIGLILPDAIGMGDAKLALVVALGLLDKALTGLECGLLLAGSFGVAGLVRNAKGREGAIPLAPFLALGALIALLAGSAGPRV